MTPWGKLIIGVCWIAVISPGFAVVEGLAQAYPSKPLRLVVGFSAGGATDVTARMLAQHVSPLLGQIVTVENRTGASGAIATERVATSPADGYTLLLMTAADALLPALRPKLPYNLERDFAPVALVATAPFVLVTHPSVPARNVRELIALARGRTAQLNYGSFGSGSSAHLMGELFKQMAAVKIVHVPYKGAAEASTAVVSGEIDMSFVAVGTALPLITAGRIKPLAVTSSRRTDLLPGIPTMDESGLSGYDRSGWYGVVAPAGVPRDVVATLNAAILKSVATAEMKKVFERHGLEAQTPQTATPAYFATFLHGEITRNAKLIATIGLKAD